MGRSRGGRHDLTAAERETVRGWASDEAIEGKTRGQLKRTSLPTTRPGQPVGVIGAGQRPTGGPVLPRVVPLIASFDRSDSRPGSAVATLTGFNEKFRRAKLGNRGARRGWGPEKRTRCKHSDIQTYPPSSGAAVSPRGQRADRLDVLAQDCELRRTGAT